MPAPLTRVLFLGLDGGTTAVLKPGFERGWLPNLAELWRRSAVGSLRSSAPMVTPVAWTSFATGSEPPEHGIHEFYYVDSVNKSIRPNDATRVRTPTIWEILDADDREVVSLNLPMTYPPSKVKGIVVAGSDAPGLDWAFAQCPEFAADVRRLIPEYTNAIVWKRRPRSLDELRGQAALNRAIFRAQAEAALLADRSVDWSAMLVHFHNLDSLQHRLWPYLNIDDTGVDQPAWTDEVVGCLKALDDSVGVLLELASRRQAAVIALSDHGFGPCRALVNVNGLLRRHGLQKGLAYGTRFRYRAHRIADRFRRWIDHHHTPGTASARRRPRSILGQVGCDWRRTVAYAPFGQLSGCVFLTDDVRQNENAAQRLRREIIDIFREVRDPETDVRLFREVFDVAERYDLDPVADGIADILALSADGYQAQAKWGVGVRDNLLEVDPDLPATHYLSGVVAIDAPGVRPGDRIEADLRDIAPTSLALLDVAIPSTMTGRVLHEAFIEPLAVERDDNARTINLERVLVPTGHANINMLD